MSKAFDNVWMNVLFYKLTLLNFASFIVSTISSFLRGRTFEVSFQTATSFRRDMRAGWMDSPALFSLYIKEMPSPSHVDLVLHADDTAITATFRSPTLLLSYKESYLNDLQRWLSDWRIAINVSKNIAISFQPRPVTLIGEPNECVDTTRYLVVTLDTQLNCLPHIDQIR